MLRIEAPDRSRTDEPITLRIAGARPNETVAFEAAIEDRDGVEWRSTATFTADGDGAVALAERAPESGSYEGVAPMGWCWSMRAADEDQPVTALMTAEPTTVRLRATAGDRRADRTITRTVGDGVEATAVDRDGIVGTVYEPAGRGPHPGVLALHGSSGEPIDYTAALLASRGFAAFALRYVGDRDALPERIVRVPLSYFDRAAAWFRDRPCVTGDRLGIVGHSRGGEAGLLLGERYDWVGAVVSYAGSAVVWDTPSRAPAWIGEDGEVVPYVTGRGKPTLREGQLDAADERTRRRATIAVEEIDAPILFVTGAEDPIWPAARTAELAIDRLDRAAFDHAYEHRCYERVGHFVTPPYLPKTHDVLEGAAADIARADADAWSRVPAYLVEGLGPPADRGPGDDGPS